MLPLALLSALVAPTALSPQDFDGDGYDDLAIGVPGEDVGGVVNAGAVMVLYGTASRLNAAGDQFWTQDSTGVPGTAAANEYFGTALAHGDFNGDGYDDLVIGAPNEGVGRPLLGNAGTVTVLLGSPNGISSSGAQVWSQDSAGIADSAESGDLFGSALWSGDFNGDGYADLAVAATQEDVTTIIGTTSNAGAVHVLYGSGAGLTSAGSQFWHQNTGGIQETCGGGDGFGERLTAGDFDGNGCDDLVIAVPKEDQGPVLNAGAVHVIFGTTAGLSATGSELWYQASESFPDDPGAFDSFGEAVAAGDFDGDGYDDLAIGAGHEDTSDGTDAGMVAVIYGDPTGLSTVGAELIRQSMIFNTFVLTEADPYDLFGSALAAGDFDGDGCTDLAIGAWNDHVEPNGIAGGCVDVVYGSVFFGLLVGPGSQHWAQNKLAGDSVETGDHFGMTLTVGDFDGTGRDALAIGAPDEDLGTASNCGLVQVIYGDATALSSSGSQIWSQDSLFVADSIEAGDRIGAGL
ncbi:MAG: hypothetical protein EYC70_02655 [Planctomycetota bacterium]|nr:MAG: hypothetical protein EYC70_02655 [Planctomycetota bacterium]